MPAPTNETLANMIENLTKTVEEGFKGIHERQDKTNGNVKENMEFRITQQNTNKWIYRLMALIIIPVGLMFVQTFLA